MDSNKLRHFKVIAKYGSLTKAAEKLYISQPALSKALSSLEDELGCQLFNRVRRRLYINENGKKLLKYADEIDAVFQRLSEEFRRQPERVLSIYGVGDFFTFILKDYFKDGMKPVKLSVVPDTAIPELLFSGEADVAIADDYYLKGDTKIGLYSIPMLNEQLLLSVSTNHALAEQKSVKIKELEPEQIMRATTSNGTNNWLDKIIELNNISINWSMALDTDTWHYYMSNISEDVPPCFASSSLYLTSREYQYTHKNRVLVKVEGIYTNRMICLWYFAKNKEFLSEFLQCIKNIYCL